MYRRVFPRSLSFYSTAPKSHYDTLGLQKHATNDEIKQAYYEQSKLHHPDLKTGNPDKFKDINSAYEVLGNPRLRKMYDRGLVFEQSNEESEPQDPETVISSGELHQWSKEQLSKTFQRDQMRKYASVNSQKFKVYKKETRGSQSAFIVLIGGLVFGGYLFESFKDKKVK